MENKALNILLQNIRSMPKNFDNFNVYLETLSIKPMIICLTETWLNDRFNPSLFNLNEYHSPKSVNRKKRGGGVLIYAHRKTSFEIVNSLNHNKLQILTARVKLGSISILLSCIYLPPPQFCESGKIKHVRTTLRFVTFPTIRDPYYMWRPQRKLFKQ